MPADPELVARPAPPVAQENHAMRMFRPTLLALLAIHPGMKATLVVQ